MTNTATIMSATKLQRKPAEPYQQTVDEVVAALSTDLRLGLSEAEAHARLARSELSPATQTLQQPDLK